jgi:murein DD-endopeptidase MepM/ murein hydrolase activator NlpD
VDVVTRAQRWSPWVALAVAPWVWLPARDREVAPLAASARAAEVARIEPEGARCDGVMVADECLRPRCAVGELDLDGFCLPTAGAVVSEGTMVATNAHTERTGRRVIYEHIPRRPEVPEDYDRFVYPVPTEGGRAVSSGYDLDRPDGQQRRGAGLSATGHGGVDLPQPRNTPVRVAGLRGEQGDPEVVYVGRLFGNTVLLRQVVREGDALWTYLTLYGHLEAAAQGLARGMFVRTGAVVGYVGDSGAEGIVHLHYEVRRVRAGVDVMREEIARVTEQEVSVPCDPRNVLPWR